MWKLALAGLALALVWIPGGKAVVPESVIESRVTWTDADFEGELGILPIGNGDVSAAVWVDSASGDLLAYISKSDAFDQNSQPIKIGRLRMSFAPPLWSKSSSSFSSDSDPSSNSNFAMTLSVDTGSIDIKAGGLRIKVLVDANSNTFRVVANQTATAPFNLTTTLEIYRDRVKQTSLGRGFCSPRFDLPDTVVPVRHRSVAAAAAVGRMTWFHRNSYGAANETRRTAYYTTTMLRQGVDPASAGLVDPFENLTFGGQATLTGGGGGGIIRQVSDRQLLGLGLRSVVLEATVVTSSAETPDQWLSELQGAVEAEASRGPVAAKQSAHDDWWSSFWSRSHIILPNRSPPSGPEDDQRRVESRYVWARYLDACDGRGSKAPIKFNGRTWNVDQGHGPDYRGWGADYWFQNTRQSYYNTLASGDLDILRPWYEFFHKSLQSARLLTSAQLGGLGVKGAFWPETTTSFATYNEGDWGCHTPPTGPSSNTYIRFHTTGNLELALFMLDDYEYTNDEDVMRRNLPILTSILEFYATRYPQRNRTTGKLDMFPAQALETCQCINPSRRDQCVTNPATDISGLMAVLTRATQLPHSIGVPAATLGSWHDTLAVLPGLLLAPSTHSPGKDAVQPHDPQYTLGDRNSENTALYTVHPFRIFGVGKPSLPVGVATYYDRPHPCNVGWCQDIVDAAMLGLTQEAVKLLAERAAQTSVFRWRGFAGHFQDYPPSEDHFGFMRTAMHYMLLGPVDDRNKSMLLFPAWPTDKWDVQVKLHAPLETVVEAACINNTLTYLNVTPPSRRAHVTILNCANPAGL